jgi:ubiquitin carboxyl-terminal hydrolase 36/42
MYSLVEDVWTHSTKKSSLSPRTMVQNIRRVGRQFRPHRQEDAHEYLRQLLDCMHEEILKANNVKISDGKVAETTLISRVFGGSLRNELKCLSCRFSSKTYNHFQDLSLEISGGISSGDFIHVKFIKHYSQLIIGSHSIEAAPPNRNE